MEQSIAELFVILALKPEKGRIGINSLHFRYSLTGAMLMDYLLNKEIEIANKRIVPSFRKNGDTIHDMIADRISRSGRNRRVSFWVKRLTNRSRLYFKSYINLLVKERIIRIERKKFLGIIPFNRYWFTDTTVRINLIGILRGILLYGKQPGNKELMLLGIIDASKGYNLLSRERGESGVLRKKCRELLKGDLMSSEINHAIRDVQIAVSSAITAAIVASHGAH